MKYPKTWILLSSCFILLSACNRTQVAGNGDVQKQSRTVQSFNAVQMAGNFTVQLQNGTAPQLVVTTDSNLLPYITTTVTNNTLAVESKEGVKLEPTKDILVDLTSPQFSTVKAAGSINLTATKLKATDIEFDLDGAAKATLSGTANKLTLQATGACDVDAKDLVATQVVIRATGACKIVVNANKKLDIKTAGASKITYYGSPSNIKQSVTGAASIKQG